MEVLLVAGGSPAEWPQLELETFDYFVGIDRGSLYILEHGWPLDLAVGDFDSLSGDEKHQVQKQASELVQAQAEKDDTDTQLALALAFKKFPQAKVTLIGATGGRLDHFLANLWLPLDCRFQSYVAQLVLKDKQNTIAYYLPGDYTVKKEQGMHYLAYCCLTAVTNLNLTESKYTLAHENVPFPKAYASNEFVKETAQFSFETGMVAVIQSKDIA